MNHLAIFTDYAIKNIFSGKKTVDSRFSIKKIPPYQKVSSGDLVYIKKSGGKILGQFKVCSVIYFDNLNEELFMKIKKDYNKYIQADKYFWNDHLESKYGTLMFISEVQPVLFPIYIQKRDRRPWVVLTDFKVKMN